MENNRLILHIAPHKDVYCPFDPLDSCAMKKPSKLLQEELHRFMEANLIIIDLDYTLTGDFEGIDLLKLIRLHHINTHCIVYSFHPESYHVKRDANKSILLSEGVTYVQMCNYIDKDHQDFATLAKQKSPEDLRDYFWHDYQQCFSNNRHFNANWWGPLRIMEYLKRADKIEDEDSIFQGGNAEILRQKLSYNGLVLRYVKSLKEQSVRDSEVETFMRESKMLKKENRQLQQDMAAILDALQNVSTNIKKEIILSAATYPMESVLNENIERIKTGQQKIDQYNQRMNSQHADNASTNNIEKLRNVLAAKKPKFLYLDDMAGYGWNVVLQRLIYKKDHSDFFDILTSFSDVADDYDQLAETLTLDVKQKDYHLIILDVRLKNEKDEIKPQALSGIKLLEALRKKQVPCPILVITASKNPDTIDQVYASGADACWCKEGIDENNSTNPVERLAYTWSKIEQLLTMIYTLCGEEFQYLYKTMLAKYYHTIEQQVKGYYWWEVIGTCNNTGMESISKEQFLKQLNTTILDYQEILIDKLKGRTKEEEFLVPCQSMFTIMETIHPKRKIIDENGDKKEITGFKCLLDYDFHLDSDRINTNRLPPFLQSVFNAIYFRNNVIHLKEKGQINFRGFKQCVENLIENYLMVPYAQLEKKFPGGKLEVEEDDSIQENAPITAPVEEKVDVAQGQKVVFASKPVINYVLEKVTIAPKEFSKTDRNDHGYIKALQKWQDGTLSCQLYNTFFSTRVIDKMDNKPKGFDQTKAVYCTPTRFNENGHIEIDFYYDDSTRWHGMIGEFVDLQHKKRSTILTGLNCLNNDMWFTILNNDDFDVTRLMVGDSIQFRLKGSCELSGNSGELKLQTTNNSKK